MTTRVRNQHGKARTTGYEKRTRRPARHLRTVQRQQIPSPAPRLRILLVAMCAALAVIGAQVVKLQVVDGSDLYARGYAQRVKTIDVFADRGTVMDRNGVDLAISVPRTTVWADPRVIKHPTEVAARLAPIIKIRERRLRATLGQKDKAFVYVKRQVEDDVAQQIANLKIKGIYSYPESKRYYPAGALAAPVVGFVGTDNNGLGGVEYAYERRLAGQPGQVVVEKDPRGREIPVGPRQIKPVERGQDIVLTLDTGLQYQVEQMLMEGVLASHAKGGTAIIADVVTGEVLSMASVDGPSDTTPPRPARAASRNRPLTDVYEPGSTNKVITLAAAVQEGVVGPNTPFDVPDWIKIGDGTFEDSTPHPVERWSTTEIMSHSSNVGTIMIGQHLGKQRMDTYLRAFGFGSPTNIGFPGEAPGILLDPENYSDTSMATVPIGNGLAVTAAQMLEVFMTIANDGQSQPLKLLQGEVGENGKIIPPKNQAPRQVVSPKTATIVTDMLQEVVKTGTGKSAQIPGYEVAGKTGTARKPPYEHPPYRYIASFAGFAPADNPRLAAIVVIDEPANIYGGIAAAPVFARTMQYALRHQGVAPNHEAVGTLEVPTTSTSTTSTTTTTAPGFSAAGTSVDRRIQE